MLSLYFTLLRSRLRFSITFLFFYNSLQLFYCNYFLLLNESIYFFIILVYWQIVVCWLFFLVLLIFRNKLLFSYLYINHILKLIIHLLNNFFNLATFFAIKCFLWNLLERWIKTINVKSFITFITYN